MNKSKKQPKKTQAKSKGTSSPVKPFSWKTYKWRFSSLATLGPIGYFPKGSGTLGALIALPIAYILNRYCLPALLVVTLVLFGLGLLAVYKFTKNTTEKDPSCVIIDEVVGQLIPFLTLIPDFMHWPMLFLGFILFRFFDIYKFGTVVYWDRQKDPAGVMLDDVSAGIWAGFFLSMTQVIMVEYFHM